jgi:hypothetical protein
MNILEAMADPNVFAPHFRGPSWKAWKSALAAMGCRPGHLPRLHRAL